MLFSTKILFTTLGFAVVHPNLEVFEIILNKYKLNEKQRNRAMVREISYRERERGERGERGQAGIIGDNERYTKRKIV